MQTGTADDQVGTEMSDRIEAPLTTERRYGFSRIGCAIAVIMIVVAVGVGVALLMGIRDAGIMLAILLPMIVLTAVLANLFLWWQHKKAVRNRELATSDQSSRVPQGLQASAPPETPRSSVSWFRRFSQRSSTRSTPPPGYQSVFGGS